MPSVKDFPELPELRDLLRTSSNKQAGVPGFSYLICLANEEHIAAPLGWERLRDMPLFTIAGQPAAILGYGQAIPNLAIGDVKCAYFYSKGLLEVTKLPVKTTKVKAKNKDGKFTMQDKPVAKTIDLAARAA